MPDHAPTASAPRWLWRVTLLAMGLAAVPGVWAAHLFIKPPSVEEQPEGMIFMGAFFVLTIAVPAATALLLALGLRRRRPRSVPVLLAVSLICSCTLTLPMIVMALTFLISDPSLLGLA